MPRTVLRSATKRPVRYSAKWRRWHSLAKRSAYRAKASWTTRGNSMMPGMSRCSAVQLRQGKSGQNPRHSPYFDRLKRRFAKDKFPHKPASFFETSPFLPPRLVVAYQCAVEQRLARQAHNLEVAGSIPAGAI